MKMWALNESTYEADNEPKVNALATMMGLSSIGEDPNHGGDRMDAASSFINPRASGGGGGLMLSPGSPSRIPLGAAGVLPGGRGSGGHKDLPPLFWYMETGDWERASDRVQRHPKEVKTWATLKTKSAVGTGESTTTTTKRLALHHACFKLRGAGAVGPPNVDDPFIEVCRFILMLIKMYPDAAQKRESRHGCLPLHLAAFASCAPRDNLDEQKLAETIAPILAKPVVKRTSSDQTTETNMSAVQAEENFSAAMSDKKRSDNPNVSVSMRRNTGYSLQREDMLVQVINALLDAYPKAARVDSEGGRLPLHTACAGRATPRVVSTLVTANPAAARQRNKDGFLPLHLAAHWGVSHISVAVQLLRTYPDATVGRNRWERTPLEEALCMAGENGRPHQAALVKALRKHPSWWTRPDIDALGSSNRSGHKRGGAGPHRSPTIVDVDESLASGDTMEEQLRLHQQRLHQEYFEDEDESSYEGDEMGSPNVPAAPGLISRLSPRFRKGKRLDAGPVVADPLGVGVSLAHLIERKQWSTVLARIKQEPLEAEQDLQVMTRGGFMSGTGMSPLHYSCERKPPVDVVKKLIEANNVVILTRSMPGGCLPLHIACTWGASPDVIKVLVAADPGSARVKDELGNIPLHSACFSGANIQVIEALLKADPKSLLARNHQGSRPVDISKRLRHDNRAAVIDLWLLRKEELMTTHGRSRSSGLLSDMARDAEEMNQREGAPAHGRRPSFGFRAGDNLQDTVGVEVTYGQAEQLNWI